MTNQQTEAGRSARPTTEPEKTKVWDIVIRIFHWTLVTSFAVAWVSSDEWDKTHEAAGYVIAILLAIRIVWGIIGSPHARFRDFIYKPSTVLSYLRDTLFGKAKRYIGHNPAGGAMVIAMLVSLIIATGTGIASTSNMFWGVEWIEDLHEITAEGTLVLIFLHIAGVIYASFEHKENLVKAMITGWKKKPSD